MDEARVHPETRAGDPFTSFAPPQDHPHACLNGYIYLGYTAVDEETGEEVERVEALPCRRCASETELTYP
jgi:hypothetical protein